MTSDGPARETERVFCFSLSFWTDPWRRNLMRTLGFRLAIGLPGPGDTVLVWGRGKAAARGLRIAQARGCQVVTLEDGFIRSLRTGREGDRPRSVIVDRGGLYTDADSDSDLQRIIDAGADGAEVIRLIRDLDLSKYNAFPAAEEGLPDRYVLVIDQTRGDASIAGAGADAGTFADMLAAARAEHPGVPVLIKTHPETMAGKRDGHFSDTDGMIWDRPVSPWQILGRAKAVYCVSSLMGWEAILSGHRPVVFGRAFFAGRGLTEDRVDIARKPATVADIAGALYGPYSRWIDPETCAAVTPWESLQDLSAEVAAWRAPGPMVFAGMRLWKRGFLRRYFATSQPRFEDDPAQAVALAGEHGCVAVWSGKETATLRDDCAAADVPLLRVEDGFLRSRGLGAELVAPASLALDDLGIYYDPTRESRLERLIAASGDLSPRELERSAALRRRLVAAGMSKYNLGGGAPDVTARPGQQIVLVPGQVEDDQSILKGAGDVRTNLALLAAARQAFPQAHLVYKPHPDVVAGLRDGGDAGDLADQVVDTADMARVLDRVDRVATITSLTGFEALLRGKPVTCFGVPFYAGWGLTDDRMATPDRRGTATLDGLVHAALIGYPRYWDPLTGRPCSVETLQRRFEAGTFGRSATRIRMLAKAQGLLASYAHLWR